MFIFLSIANGIFTDRNEHYVSMKQYPRSLLGKYATKRLGKPVIFSNLSMIHYTSIIILLIKS